MKKVTDVGNDSLLFVGPLFIAAVTHLLSTLFTYSLPAPVSSWCIASCVSSLSVSFLTLLSFFLYCNSGSVTSDNPFTFFFSVSLSAPKHNIICAKHCFGAAGLWQSHIYKGFLFISHDSHVWSTVWDTLQCVWEAVPGQMLIAERTHTMCNEVLLNLHQMSTIILKPLASVQINQSGT